MYDQLRLILKELIAEFEQSKELFACDPALYHAIKLGMYAAQGSSRYSTTHTTNSAICYDYGIMSQIVGRFIAPFISTKKLYDFIVQNNLWHEQYESFEKSQRITPSMMTKIGGGFLCRNFALNGDKIGISVLSFEIAFNELIRFFKKNSVEYDIYIHLRGCKGDIDTVIINDEVSIIKADFEIAKLFSLHYHVNRVHGVEMFEGDYLLKVKFNVPKTDYSFGNLSRHNTYEYKTIQKWLTLPIFATIGYLNIGKRFSMSNDWALSVENAIGPFGSEETIPNDQFSEITEQTITELKKAGELLKDLNDINAIDTHIINSIVRLKRSKASIDINDRTVELAIAFEHLIDSEPNEVTYQLCIKSIRLFDENNLDEHIYKKLKDFYAMRSKVVHGTEKGKKMDKNDMEKLIDYAENIIQQMIFKMLKLNQNYTYKQINDAISKSIYISRTIEKLLEQANQSSIK